MSALVERIIAARDALKGLTIRDFAVVAGARDVMADAANRLAALEPRLKELEGWWYALPEEQRFEIMAAAAWKRHEAAGPK